MKQDLDSLLQNRDLDALLVVGPALHNPSMYYFTGNVHLGSAHLLKLRGAEPVLYYQSMEREEAARTGLKTSGLDQYPMIDLMKQMDGDYVRAVAARFRNILCDAGLTQGRLVIFGQIDAGEAYGFFTTLQQMMPELEIVGQAHETVLLDAMATKDPGEIERIRQMGQVTTWVVGQTADFLTSQRVKDDRLVKADGSPVTIGEVKGLINRWLSEKGAENPEGTIFSSGRDAGVPHSTGNPADPIRLGQTLVYDIFPCEAGGGYFYDFTRTWCMGYAPEPVQALYEDVLAVYQQISSELKLGVSTKKIQERTCELFEARGHATIRTDPRLQEGYVHSLGHGVGLHVHERPWFSAGGSDTNRLDPGAVFTVEPGLYYPSRGMGVRLEDTVWARPDGGMEVLAEYPLDLVLPVKS